MEGETLACGSGAVATAILLATWGLTPSEPVRIETRSGRVLTVSWMKLPSGSWKPTLAGEGRVIYQGVLSEI